MWLWERWLPRRSRGSQLAYRVCRLVAYVPPLFASLRRGRSLYEDVRAGRAGPPNNGHTSDTDLSCDYTSRFCILVSRTHFRSDQYGGSSTCLSALSVSLRREYHAELAAQEYFRHGTAHERSEEHTSELQSRGHLVCRLLLEKKKKQICLRHLSE